MADSKLFGTHHVTKLDHQFTVNNSYRIVSEGWNIQLVNNLKYNIRIGKVAVHVCTINQYILVWDIDYFGVLCWMCDRVLVHKPDSLGWYFNQSTSGVDWLKFGRQQEWM